jgi:high affinity Mn2+ porin
MKSGLTMKPSLLALSLVAALASPAIAADLAPPPLLASSPWEGFYFGGHLGYAWANSNWSTPGVTGSVSLTQTIDTFAEAGSFFEGIHGGYNYLLPNRVVIGVEGDASFPAFPNLRGFGIGGTSTFTSPWLGTEIYSDNVLAFGTVRGRIGYVLDNDWLLYATGGFAWTRDQLSLTRIATGTNDYPTLWRFGWAAGAGVEAPIAPHWTALLEYLFTDYGATSPTFPAAGQQINSNLTMHELRAALTYHFDDEAQAAGSDTSGAKPAADTTDSDRVNFHTQATFTAQGYPQIRSPYQGANSFLPNGQAAETADATLYVGLRLWQGAELWIDPEIDQGFGLANTHGAAGFPSAEAYKLGLSYPYARVQRYFIRDTINLGGESQNVDADINQFAGTQTADRLVLTVGKFAIPDIFDTNKYANNPKSDFLNWGSINTATFDYAGDAWGFTYGAAAEWYQGDWTLRGGVFDMSAVPAESADSGPAYGLDPTFAQFQMVGEVERRYELLGQPGTIKVTGFVTRGRMATFTDAIALSQATGLDINDATAASRVYQSRPGVSVNLAQQLTENVGLFARAGWVDGDVEPWDFTDADRTVEAGVSINGKQWGRPNDTFGILGMMNGIDRSHAAWLNAGGLGILIGDGQLPYPTLEKILETYYSFALTPALKISFDYQFIGAPAFNPQRGPVSVGAVRLHVQF